MKSTCELAHHDIQRILRFEADARTVGKLEIAFLYFGVVGEAGEDAEYARISLATAQPEAAVVAAYRLLLTRVTRP